MTLAAPFESADAAKFEAAFNRSGRGGLGFSKGGSSSATSAVSQPQTDASRALLGVSSAFSARSYLERYGWKSGSGLGARGDGIGSYVKPAKKFDQSGVGAGITGALVTNAAFETLFNNMARNVKIAVVIDSSDDSDSGSDDNDDAAKKRARKDKKRKREKSECESDDDNSGANPAPSLAFTSSLLPTSGLTGSLALAFRKSSLGLLSDESITVTAQLITQTSNPIAAFDPDRNHMYHDRSSGKLARLKLQDAKLSALTLSSSSSDDDSADMSATTSNEGDDSINEEDRAKSMRKRAKEERRAAAASDSNAGAGSDAKTEKKKKEKKSKKREAE